MTDEAVHESEETRSRRGISTFFRRLARRLGRGEKVPVDDEQTVAFDAPAEADLNVELTEGDDGTVSLGIEMEFEDGAIDTEADESKATFELYEDEGGDYRWRLRHDNGNIIADSSEGYASKQKAKQGLESVKTNAAGGHVVDQTRDEAVDDEASGSKATFEIFQDSGEKWRWRLRHDNGNIIADCGGSYSSKQKTKQGLRSVKVNSPGAAVVEE
ncbi:MAG: YegP family protein [Natronomonas sp.]